MDASSKLFWGNGTQSITNVSEIKGFSVMTGRNDPYTYRIMSGANNIFPGGA